MVVGQDNATGFETSVEPRPTDATGSGTSVEPRPTADGEWNFRRTATDGRGMGWKKKRGKDGDWYVVKGTRRGVELPSNRDRRPTGSGTSVEPRPTADGSDGEWNFRRTATDGGGGWDVEEGRRKARTGSGTFVEPRPTADRRTPTGSGASVEPRPTADGRTTTGSGTSVEPRPTDADGRTTDRPTDERRRRRGVELPSNRSDAERRTTHVDAENALRSGRRTARASFSPYAAKRLEKASIR